MAGKFLGAWSNLRLILAQRNLSVLDLHKQLEANGLSVNVKSLYRLAAAQPLWKVDMRIVHALCQALEVELGDLIQLQKPARNLQRLDARKQTRMEALMDRNNEGQLTADERTELTRLVEEAQRISLYNGQVLLEQRRRRQQTERDQKIDRKKTTALTR
ncbi:MAG: helix-turn-helix domain-containing protein [Verrucomicrobia bacterium]|nr:helix-turn-helix domain-containing protein [Verrucomicrobiota bacterium]